MSFLHNLVNNTSNPNPNPTYICGVCNNNSTDGNIHKGVFYCDTCVQDPWFVYPSSPVPPPTHTPPSVPTPSISSTSVPAKPRTGGTCANCNNIYGYCIDSIDDGKNWFCGKTCSRVYRPKPTNSAYVPSCGFGLFASNMMTVYPIRSGFTRLGYKIEY